MPQINKAKLIKRTVSALVLAPLTLYLIIKGGVLFSAFMAIAFCIAFYEWITISKKNRNYALYLLLGFVYLGLSFYTFYALVEMKVPLPETCVAGTSSGPTCILDDTPPLRNYMFPLALLIVVWLSDIGAYFFGKFIGGPKLWPSISPNKTWAGLLGAVLVPMIPPLFLILPEMTFEKTRLISFVIIFGGIALISLLSQAGDLLISKLKRIADVKDTSNLIPGHGGLLDRIDGLLFVCFCLSPFVLLKISLLSYVTNLM